LLDVAKYPNFTYAGNVPIGNGEKGLPLTSLVPHYDAVLFAYGASRDRALGIPGEDMKGVLSARAFVGWYNGLPEYAHLTPDLQSGDTAVVIGQGNVALDVTRILLAPLDELRKTDISEEAVETLSRSKITSIKIIGRRGPLQAPYTIKELRELMHLPGVGFKPPPEPWDDLIQVSPRKKLPRQLKRIAELLEKGSKTPLEQAHKAWQLGYLRSPAAFLSSNNDSLEAVGFEQTAYVQPLPPLLTGDQQADLSALRSIKVQPTGGDKSLIRTSLAFRSVGYQSEPLAGMEEVGVPFDQNAGIIPNDRWGRVISPGQGPNTPLAAGHVPGFYCAGWVKRGPTGVIASTMDDAFTTADIIAKDWMEGVKFIASEGEGEGMKDGWEGVQHELAKRGIRRVSWGDFEKIDEEERRRGAEKGKVREKIRSVEGMLAVLDG
jgi:adrenodoxin-NADP+ reductase